MYKLATHKIFSSVGTLGILLVGACSICDGDRWASVVHPDSPLCIEAIDPTKPRLDWVMSRVPIDVPEFEATGQGLDWPNVKLWLADQSAPALGGAKVPVSVERLPDMVGQAQRWRIKPQWASASLAPGQGRLLISSNDQEVAAKTTILVHVEFKEKQMSTVSGTGDSVWIYMGNTGESKLFLYRNTTLSFFPYTDTDGSFGTPIIINNQGLSVSPIDLGRQTPTEFAFVKLNPNDYKVVNFYYDSSSSKYQETDATAGGIPKTDKYINVATGRYGTDTQPKLLWAFLDSNMDLRTCPEQRPSLPLTDADCKKVRLSPQMYGMWVKPLRALMPPDVVLFEPAGLHILRPDLTPNEYALPKVNGAGVPNAVAFVESNTTKRIDLVTTHTSGVVLYRNDGQGALSPFATNVPTMPVAQALVSMNLDNDGKPDLLIKATDGKLWLMLNESDGSFGDGLFSAPVAVVDTVSKMPIDVGAKGQAAGDGSTAERLITYTPMPSSNDVLRSWDRQAMPSN